MSKLKKMILDAAIRKQEGLISDFRDRVNDALATDGNVNEESYDNHQQTFHAQVLAEVNLLTDEVEFATHELMEMKKIDPDLAHGKVEYGSMVRTDWKSFFVSAGLEEFKADGERYFGISINSPVYQSMKGKKAGDSFTCRGTKYVIEAIY
jgi:hypothetical protein